MQSQMQLCVHVCVKGIFLSTNLSFRPWEWGYFWKVRAFLTFSLLQKADLGSRWGLRVKVRNRIKFPFKLSWGYGWCDCYCDGAGWVSGARERKMSLQVFMGWCFVMSLFCLFLMSGGIFWWIQLECVYTKNIRYSCSWLFCFSHICFCFTVSNKISTCVISFLSFTMSHLVFTVQTCQNYVVMSQRCNIFSSSRSFSWSSARTVS